MRRARTKADLSREDEHACIKTFAYYWIKPGQPDSLARFLAGVQCAMAVTRKTGVTRTGPWWNGRAFGLVSCKPQKERRAAVLVVGRWEIGKEEFQREQGEKREKEEGEGGEETQEKAERGDGSGVERSDGHKCDCEGKGEKVKKEVTCVRVNKEAMEERSVESSIAGRAVVSSGSDCLEEEEKFETRKEERGQPVPNPKRRKTEGSGHSCACELDGENHKREKEDKTGVQKTQAHPQTSGCCKSGAINGGARGVLGRNILEGSLSRSETVVQGLCVSVCFMRDTSHKKKERYAWCQGK